MNFKSYATVWFRIVSLYMVIEGLAGIVHFFFVKLNYTDKASWILQGNDDRLFVSCEYIIMAFIFLVFSGAFGRYVGSHVDP